MKKRKPLPPVLIQKPEEKPDIVRFCINCDDMDNLATSSEVENLDALRERFRNCDKTGNFNGDICSRLFVAEPGDQPGPIFDDE
jgi:hypothetical protein